MVAITIERSDPVAYAKTGLPRAAEVFNARTSSRHGYDLEVGRFAHRILATVVEQAQTLPRAEQAVLVEDKVNTLQCERRWGRADKVRLRVAGLVGSYLRFWLPPQPVTFIGAEIALPGGRIDLAWTHPELGVWFDEIKTWRNGTTVGNDDEFTEQMSRYLDAGTEAYGDRFAGVRFLTLGYTNACVHVTAAGANPLVGSPLDLAGLDTEPTTAKVVAP